MSSGFDPEAFRTYATSDGFLDALDAQDAAAPPEIAADVKTDNEWVRTRKLELLEEFDYDLRRLMLEGSAEDLAAFTYFDPAIVEQDSRVVAYVRAGLRSRVAPSVRGRLAHMAAIVSTSTAKPGLAGTRAARSSASSRPSQSTT